MMYGCRWQPSGDGVNVFHSTANEANMEGRSAIDNAKAEAQTEKKRHENRERTRDKDRILPASP